MVRKKWSPREILLGVAFLLACVVTLTFYVWYQTESLRLGVAISRQESRIRALEDEIRKLEIRKAALLAPERVDKMARQGLGFVDPKDGDVIYSDREAPR